MSTPTATTGPVEAPGVDLAKGDDGAAERGDLTIAWSVVRKIAEHAADRTTGTTTVPRRLAGLGLGETGTTAKVTGYGDQVDLRLEVPLVYPAPIAGSVDGVRDAVRDRVEVLTGYRVRALDVTVSALADRSTSPARPAGRVE